MKNIILKLIEEKPKHYAKIISNNAELLEWVNTNSISTSTKLPARIYSAIHQINDICKYGHDKKFNTISVGFINCGRANSCHCTKESVSNTVSISKSKNTIEEKLITNTKRATTNMEKYGVINIGQTTNAIQAHNDTYNNPEKVATIVKKVADSKLARHGDATYNNSKQIKETFKEKYKTEYWVERYDNENLYILNDKEQLTELYQIMNPYELATKLEVHVQTVYRYLNLHKLREPFKSEPEKELVRFLNSLGITNIIQNNRRLIPSHKEIDIYLPDFKVAIEYNGVYWHHEAIDHITKSYHYDKYKECNDLGIQLITIFSNFWNLKKPIVKQALINKLGISNTSIHARKCIIQPVIATEAKQFLINNHVQGHAPSSMKYGLYHNNQLVSLMTFGRSRVGIGKSEDGFELIRYASSSRVMGGASKLLNHFIKNHTPEKIVSYSDNEWSDGNLYSVLGFTLEQEIKPSYWFVTPRSEHLYHRFNFSKQKLKDKGHDVTLKSVNEIITELGLLKIWDCGKKRWVLKL